MGMSTKYYVDSKGNYLGGWDGKCDVSGAIEVEVPPGNANQKWDGAKYLPFIDVQREIDDLENSITKRNYREFVMGNQYSIDKINQVEADIAILRAKL